MFSLFISSMALLFALKSFSKIKEAEALIQQKRRELEEVKQDCIWNEQYIKKVDEKSYMMYDNLRGKINGNQNCVRNKIPNI